MPNAQRKALFCLCTDDFSSSCLLLLIWRKKNFSLDFKTLFDTLIRVIKLELIRINASDEFSRIDERWKITIFKLNLNST